MTETANQTETTTTKRVPAPNRKEYDEKIDVIDKVVKELRAKMQVLEDKIKSLSHGKEEFQNSRNQIKGEMDNFDKEISTLENAKKELNEKLQKLVKDSKQTNRDLKDMEKKLGFNSEAEVDQKIAEYEYMMHRETLTLKREKELMKMIAHLKSTKPEIRKMNKMASAATVGHVENSIGGIKSEMDKVNKKLNEKRDARRVHADKFKALLDERKKNTQGLPELFDQKQALRNEVAEKVAEINTLRDEKFAKIREHQEYMKLQREARMESDEKYKLSMEAEALAAKLKTELDGEDTLPHATEIDMVENAIKYCKALIPSNAADEQATKAPTPEPVEGTVALVSKKDREEEFFFKASTGKKSKRQAKSKGASKSLKYDLIIMSLFQKLGIEAPNKAEDLAATVTLLEAKLGDFQLKQTAALEAFKAKRCERETAFLEATEKARVAKEEAEEAWKRVSTSGRD